jgi:hypothetical protein
VMRGIADASPSLAGSFTLLWLVPQHDLARLHRFLMA